MKKNSKTNIVGFSPRAFTKILTWLQHEMQLNRNDLIEELKKSNINANKVIVSSWCSNGDKPNYHTWLKIKEVLDKILSRKNLSVADFTKEATYTPAGLKKLRESIGYSIDGLSEATDIPATKLLLLESSSVENVKGMSFKDFQELVRISQTLPKNT